MSPEDMKSAKVNEADMLRDGAELSPEATLIVTEAQVDNAKNEMAEHLFARDLSKHFSRDELSEILKGLAVLSENRNNEPEAKGYVDALFNRVKKGVDQLIKMKQQEQRQQEQRRQKGH